MDDGSFQVWDENVVSTDPLGFLDERPYPQRLDESRRKSGQTESVVTGRGTLGGRPLALIAGHYRFMGGSVGVASGERIARAFERALKARLPMLALTASGGTRMQEGSLAFVQMAKAAQSVREFRAAGLLYVVFLTNPTFGGVLASWGSLGHLVFAAPGATVGFSGPRAVELTTGRALPSGVQKTDNLVACGLLDGVVQLTELKGRIDALLASLEPDARTQTERPREPERQLTSINAWGSIERSRAPARPGARELLDACDADLTEIRGDGAGGGDDRACLAALGRLSGRPCVVIAQDRSKDAGGASMAPSGYRKAHRAMRIADELGLPLVTVVDTPGVKLDRASEEGGLSAEIARCLYQLVGQSNPTVSVLLGQGAGGGALALLPADSVICAEHAWLLPIAPEGAAAIVYRSIDKAPAVAAAQGGASWDLKRFELVDTVVAEEPGWLEHVAAVIAARLDALLEEPADDRRARRRARIRAWGATH